MQSFEEIESYWMREIENYAENSVGTFLVLGNKSDLSSQRQVPENLANVFFYLISRSKLTGNFCSMRQVRKKMIM